MKLPFIGRIINQLREEQDISFQTLAQRTGLSVDRLMAIESGQITPSIGSMIKISRALGAHFSSLFDNSGSQNIIVTRATELHQRKIELADNPTDHKRFMDFYSLANGKRESSIEPMIVDIKAGEGHIEVNAEHQGEEFIYVLEGSVEIQYGNDHHTLHTGDSVFYDSSIAHIIRSASLTDSRLLIVIYTAD